MSEQENEQVLPEDGIFLFNKAIKDLNLDGSRARCNNLLSKIDFDYLLKNAEKRYSLRSQDKDNNMTVKNLFYNEIYNELYLLDPNIVMGHQSFYRHEELDDNFIILIIERLIRKGLSANKKIVQQLTWKAQDIVESWGFVENNEHAANIIVKKYSEGLWETPYGCPEEFVEETEDEQSNVIEFKPKSALKSF